MRSWLGGAKSSPLHCAMAWDEPHQPDTGVQGGGECLVGTATALQLGVQRPSWLIPRVFHS